MRYARLNYIQSAAGRIFTNLGIRRHPKFRVWWITSIQPSDAPSKVRGRRMEVTSVIRIQIVLGKEKRAGEAREFRTRTIAI